jgi:hypothetical protein
MNRSCKHCGVETSYKEGYTCKRCEHYWKKYRIRVPDYDRLLDLQHGRCAICGTNKKTTSKNAAPFCVDHCHSTGKVRGLLCVNCNAGIGSLKEDPAKFQSALNYLNLHLSTNVCQPQLK